MPINRPLPKTIRVWTEDFGDGDFYMADENPKFKAPTKVGVYLLMDTVIQSPSRTRVIKKKPK
jgi:hypothetical protein